MIRLLAKWRLTLLCALLGIMPGAMIWHLAQLQVLPGQERGYDFYSSKASRAPCGRKNKCLPRHDYRSQW